MNLSVLHFTPFVVGFSLNAGRNACDAENVEKHLLVETRHFQVLSVRHLWRHVRLEENLCINA